MISAIKVHILSLTLIGLSLFSFSIEAQSVTELSGNSTQNIKELSKGSGIFFFFKPECPACKHQVSEFNCLENSLSLVAMGFGGVKLSLWREAQKLNLKKVFGARVYQANQEVLSNFKIERGLSPQMFVFRDGEVIKHFLGLTSCDQLKRSF